MSLSKGFSVVATVSAHVAVSVSMLVVAGCVAPPPAPVPVARPSAVGPPVADVTPCGLPSNDCVLPFPSEQWVVPDPTTATGVRVEVPSGAFPASVLDQLGPGGDVAEAGVGADGFSPLAPIVLQLPDPIDPASVPPDGGELVAVWNVATGARVGVRVEVSSFLTDERGARNIVLVWPATHFDYGQRIFAAIRSGVVATDGTAVRASSSLLRASPLTIAASEVDPQGDWAEYLAATSFVVRSQSSIVADVDRMASVIRSADHPVRKIEVLPSPISGVSIVVAGQVQITDFRNAEGYIPRDGSAAGSPRWIDFTLMLPDQPLSSNGAPLVIYGHGLSVFKESMFIVAGQNAAKGYATISIDMPNHGSRIGADGGYLLDMAVPSLLGRVQSLALQGELDQLSLLKAVEQHLDTLDVAPRNWLRQSGGDGVADLDTEHIFYEGTSLGGFLGAAFVGFTPEIDGAFVQVSGSGIIDTLFHSILWGLFQGVVPAGTTTGQAHALIANAQSLLDRADDEFYLDRIRARSTPFYLVYSIGDGVVGNATSERLIREMRLPMVGTQFGPIAPDLSNSAAAPLLSMPPDGTGFQQVPTTDLDGSVLKPFLAHTQFVHPVATAALDTWLDQRSLDVIGK